MARTCAVSAESPDCPPSPAAGAAGADVVPGVLAAPAQKSDTRTMVLMGMMMAGTSAVGAITANLLPLTAKHFTSNLALIGLMVALNRICGFLVQPYAAWKSDRHVSMQGRRRPFLLVAWPVTLGCVCLLGALPFIVPVEYHRTAAVVAVLFIINLAMQASLDVCHGAANPMYGDAFAPGVLGRASAIRTLATNVAMIGMMSIAVPLADHHEFLPYLGAMFFVSIAWLVTVFGIREPIPDRTPPPVRYHPLRPLAELRDAHTRTVAIVASAVLAVLAVTEMFHALFVVETLGLSKTVLGWSATAAIVVSLLCPYAVGHVADRIGARSVLIAGFALLAVVEAAFIFWVHDRTSLYIALIVFKVACVVVYVPVMPLIFQDTPSHRRGSTFAAVQMTRAAVAGAATIAASSLAGVVGSYRMCYLVAGVVSLIGLWAALRLAPRARPAGTVAAGPQPYACSRV